MATTTDTTNSPTNDSMTPTAAADKTGDVTSEATAEYETSSATLRCGFVEVTPSLAQKWLRKNRQNRRLRNSRVDRYSDQMKDGEWLPSPDAIAFDYKGDLVNGQHRLHAVKQSGETEAMLVIWNVPPETRRIADVGIKRTPADALAVEGFKFPEETAAATRLIVLWSRGDLDQVSDYETVTNNEIVDTAEACSPRIMESVQYVNRFKSPLRGVLSRTMLMFAHFIYAPTYGDRASEFVKRFATIEGIENWEQKYESEGAVSPVKLLRERCDRGKLERIEMLTYLLQAMNWFCKEEPHSRLRLTKSVPEPEVDQIPELREEPALAL